MATDASLRTGYNKSKTDELLAAKVSTADIGNAETAAGAAMNATFVTHLGDSNGEDDSTVINEALAAAAGGKVIGKPGTTYKINAPLIVPSGTTLDMSGCVLEQTSGPMRNMLRNSGVAAARTVNDLVTAASSTTVTSATAAFTAGDVGKPIRIYLGDNGRPRFLATTISAVANATTATVATAPDTSMAVTGASIGTRDTNITIVGGDWRRYTSTFASGTNDYHTFLIRRVDGLRIAPKSMGRGAGKYMVHIADATQFTIEPFWLDSAPSDGVHIGGWSFGGVIRGVWGHTGDDIVAITAADYASYNDCAGDVSDITIESATYASANAPGRFLVSSDSSSGSLSHIKVRRVRLRDVGTRSQRSTASDPLGKILLSGVIDGVLIEDTDRYIVFDRDGGTSGTMRLDNLEVRRFRPRFDVWDQGMTLAGPTGRVLVDGLEFGPGSIGSNNTFGIVVGKTSAATAVESIEIRNFKVARTDGVAVRLVSLLYPNSSLKQLRLTNGAFQASAASGRLVDVGGSCTLDALTIESVVTETTLWDISHGGSGTTRAFIANASLGGTSPIRLANTASVELTAPATSLVGSPTLSGTGTLKPMSVDTRVDIGGVSRLAGALAYNRNASRSCGEGPVYCSGTSAGSWVHMTTGATY